LYALFREKIAVKAKKCDVTIFKSVEVSIAKTIYEHEIPVLEQVFGDGNVVRYRRHDLIFPEGKRYQVEAPDPVVYPVEKIDYEEEYYRLVTQYKIRKGSDISNAEYVYGKLEDRKMEKLADDKYQDVDIKPKKVVQEDAVSEEGNMDYQSMTNAELRELLRELKVQHPPIATKAILISLLNKADQGQLEPK
tara:strand:- start:228 stop:803 length:576 start_codon:yes stop_codon:yes gene_type:complete